MRMSTTGSTSSEKWIDCTTIAENARGYEVQIEVMGERMKTRHRKAIQTHEDVVEEGSWIDGPPPLPSKE